MLMKYLLVFLFTGFICPLFCQEGEIKITVDTVKINRLKDSLDAVHRELYKAEILEIESFLEKNMYMEAADVAAEILEKDPTLNQYRDLIAECHKKEADKKHYESVINEADQLMKNGEYDAAEEHYKYYLEKYPNDKHASKQLKKLAKK